MNGYAGIGTGIDFNHHWSAGVNFDYHKINKHHFNVDTKVYGECGIPFLIAAFIAVATGAAWRPFFCGKSYWKYCVRSRQRTF